MQHLLRVDCVSNVPHIGSRSPSLPLGAHYILPTLRSHRRWQAAQVSRSAQDRPISSEHSGLDHKKSKDDIMSRTAQMKQPVSAGHPLGASLQHSFKMELMAQEGLTAFAARSTPSSSSMDEGLPTSVRGAPAELRRIIRKRQNSESAKRCRQRKKIENARTAEEIMSQSAKVQRLEAVVQHLAQRLEETQALLASFTSASSRAVCPNGQAQCRGAECAYCVRGMQTSSASVPMSLISSPMTNIPMASSQIDSVPMLSSQMQHRPMRTMEPQGVEKHTQELQMALGERDVEDGVGIGEKVDEYQGNGW